MWLTKGPAPSCQPIRVQPLRPSCTEQGLTLRSSGRTTACHAWPSFHSGPCASCRGAPLSSNVRQHKPPSWQLLKIQVRWRVRWGLRFTNPSTMTTSPKSTGPVAAKRAKKKTAESSEKPLLRFHHSQELRVKTIEILEVIESAENPREHSGKLTELVLELTDNGMDQYFLQSL